ncbi:MAG: hypothetical protein R6X02_33480 [Enhygromyxa sp.]
MKVAGKLTALLGLPLLVLFSIFASGVYCGATRADRVVELEQRWLGIAPPEGRLLERPDAGAGADGPTGEFDGQAPSEPTPDEPKPSEPEPDAPKPEPDAPKPEPDAPKPSEPPPDASELEKLGGFAIAEAAPVGAELRARFEEPRVVRVKLMVDPALVVAREDWLSYVGGLFEATRASFDRLFGIDLRLQGLVVWDDAVGADAGTLLEDLSGRERDGADVVLGLLARGQPPEFVRARCTEERSGDQALVCGDLKQPDRYYRNLLRALALLFGAEPAHDAAAKQLGSFMSDAPARAGAAPIVDPENRGKVIINKRRPIATPSPTPSSTPPPAHSPEAPASDEPEAI